MRKHLLIYLKLIVFWLIYFVFARSLFLIYNYSYTKELTILDTLGSYFNGFRLDLSVTGYIAMICGVVFALLLPFKGKILSGTLKYLHFAMLLYATLIITADCELYRNWGFRMDSTPLLYLKTPSEAMASASIWTLILGFSLSVIIYLLSYLSLNKIVFKPLKKVDSGKWYGIPVFLIIAAAMILPIRGGVGLAPINIGSVYFSKNLYANHAAINVVWNFNQSLTNIDSENTKYTFMDQEKADSVFSELNKSTNTTQLNVLRTKTPNVLIIMLESFTSNLVGCVGGEKDVTPNLDSIASEGILFNNIYASGDRSDKGIVAILSGYPAQPTTSIIKFPKKTQNLPSLAKTFADSSYSTAYYYGGDINFANMRSFVVSSGFNQIIAMDEFDSKYYNSKWGVHDNFMFDRFFDDINKESGKFFKTFFTLSSHEPFDVPMKNHFADNSEPNRYRNSVLYADSCLGDFIRKAKKTDWWQNTLIVLVADHGTRLPEGLSVYDINKFTIPMVWTGGAVNQKAIINKIGSQTDIAKTLLSQINMNAKDYIFSNNLLLESQGYAFYNYNNGFGFIDKSGKFIFDNTGNKSLLNTDNNKTIEQSAKAVMQVYNRDFIGR